MSERIGDEEDSLVFRILSGRSGDIGLDSVEGFEGACNEVIRLDAPPFKEEWKGPHTFGRSFVLYHCKTNIQVFRIIALAPLHSYITSRREANTHT